MAIKTISQFDAAVPTDNDYILFEQNGEGKSTTISDAVNTCALSYEEIMASADLSGKVASAEALKTLGDSSYCEHVVTNNSGEYWRFASGLQICTLYKDLSKVTFQEWEYVYYYEIPPIAFPAPFAELPYTGIIPANRVGSWGGTSGDSSPSKTSWSGVAIYRPSTHTYGTEITLIAIGRWK